MRKPTALQATLALSVALVAIALAAPRRAPAPSEPRTPPVAADRRHVDLVIALDTSSSMDGLIDSARQKLWDTVNVLAKAQPQPVLRVGLISYGNSGHDASAGWVRKESDLTGDLDGLYAKLFALRTNGGEEYVARAVQAALGQMAWSADPRALKIVFVAGNEPANQDPLVAVETAVGAARDKGIFVNTIYCGSETTGESAGWRQVATAGGGRFAAIDQNSAVVIATPMDAELGALSAALNATYVGYGPRGEEALGNQLAQDKNASSQGFGVAASRAVAKGGNLYRADDWDLVDAIRGGKKSVATLARDELPAPMRAMSEADRKVFLDGKAKEREEIQRKIAEVAKRRDAFLAAERTRRGGSKGLDGALEGTLVEQARSAGFTF